MTPNPMPQTPPDPTPDPQDVQVPDDFPRDLAPAALTGRQPKVAARLIDGRYVVGLTPKERRGHYLMCQDLVEQLLAHHHKHRHDEHPMTVDHLVEAIRHKVRCGKWPVSLPEVRWIEGRLRQRLSPAKGTSQGPSAQGEPPDAGD